MKQIIRKLYANFEKEEKWLNEMADKGLNLTDYSFLKYTFEEGTPGEYIYRIELLNDLPTHPKSKEYIKFMEETGVECVATYVRWVFFRKKKSEGQFDLYSDYDSRIMYYKKIVKFTGFVYLFNVIVALYNLILGLSSIGMHTYRFNAYISIINWLFVIFFTPVLISYIRKIKKMEKEKQLYE